MIRLPDDPEYSEELEQVDDGPQKPINQVNWGLRNVVRDPLCGGGVTLNNPEQLFQFKLGADVWQICWAGRFTYKALPFTAATRSLV
jgi:hypothetical protein